MRGLPRCPMTLQEVFSSPVCRANGPEPRGDTEVGLPEDRDLSEGESLKQAM